MIRAAISQDQHEMVPSFSDSVILELYHHVWNHCRSRLRDIEYARDVAQDAMVRILSNLSESAKYSSLRSWAYGVTRNVLRESLRYEAVRAVLTKSDELTQIPSKTLDVSVKVMLRACIETLPTRQGEAIRLRYIDGLSFSEVAAEMHCDLNTAKSHVSKGRDRLRRIWLVESRREKHK